MADGGKVIIKIDGDNKGFKSAMGGIGKVAKTAFKGVAVGATAAVAAIGAIGTAAVKSFAEYEQLVGGVETLFKDSANVVKGYAEQAYKTSGMSANEYMSTITSFSASLLQSLGGDTAKAAEYGNQAVIDMSDNANKMGTSIEMIQNAYQGFAKQNYTMLDNLKLGYGGTKTEMERLLKDAQKISGIKFDISSFADVTQAIHIIQTEMGITGTTAKEAATTIQGSFGMLKASWENLMTGLADPSQDLNALVQNVVDSAQAVLSNLLPVIENILPNIAIAISALLPQVTDTITNLLPQLLPVIIDGVAQLGVEISQAIPTIIDVLVNNLPLLIDASLQIILALATGLTNALPELVPSIVEAVITIVETLIDNIDLLIDASIEIIMALADGLIKSLPMLIEKLPEIIIKICDALVENAPMLVMAALELIIMLGAGLIQAIPTLVKNIPKILEAMFKAMTVGLATMKNIGKQLVEGLWNGILKAKDWLLNKIKSFAKTITQGIKDFFGIKSPSRVFRDEVGLMITKGLAIGIDKGSTEVEKVMNEMNKTLLASEQKYLDESERLKNSKNDADKKYLDDLKEIADKERKIYDARLKDIENWQKSAVDAITKLAEQSFDKLEEVEKMQETFSKKLKDYGDLFTIEKIGEIGGKTIDTVVLGDLKQQTDVLKKYAEALNAIKNRGVEVPQGFFAELRDLDVIEGTRFAKKLLSLDEKDFAQYIEDWKERRRADDEIAKFLYKDEAETAQSEVLSSLEAFNQDLEKQGKENAEAWGDGFYEKIKEKLPDIMNGINSYFNTLIPNGQYAYAGGYGGTTNNYSATYNILPAKGESTQEQTKAIKDFNTRNEMSGGY